MILFLRQKTHLSNFLYERGKKGKKGVRYLFPQDYLEFVNTPQTKEEEEGIRKSVVRGNPYGNDEWARKMIKKFGLESTTRVSGRPKKGT